MNSYFWNPRDPKDIDSKIIAEQAGEEKAYMMYMFIHLSIICSPSIQFYLIRYALPFYILSSVFCIAVGLRLEQSQMPAPERVKKILMDQLGLVVSVSIIVWMVLDRELAIYFSLADQKRKFQDMQSILNLQSDCTLIIKKVPTGSESQSDNSLNDTSRNLQKK